MGCQPAAVLPPAVRRPRLGRPAVDRPHHVLHLVRGGRRPRPGGQHGPARSRRRRATSGASAFGAFRYVTLPLHRAGGHGRRAARLRAVVRRLRRDDVQRGRRVSSTLPLYIYGKVKFGVTPEINAISTIIVADHGDRDPARLAAGRVPRPRRASRDDRRAARRPRLGSSAPSIRASSRRSRRRAAPSRRTSPFVPFVPLSGLGRRHVVPLANRRCAEIGRRRRSGPRPSGRTRGPPAPGSSTGRPPSSATACRAAGARTRASPGGSSGPRTRSRRTGRSPGIAIVSRLEQPVADDRACDPARRASADGRAGSRGGSTGTSSATAGSSRSAARPRRHPGHRRPAVARALAAVERHRLGARRRAPSSRPARPGRGRSRRRGRTASAC